MEDDSRDLIILDYIMEDDWRYLIILFIAWHSKTQWQYDWETQTKKLKVKKSNLLSRIYYLIKCIIYELTYFFPKIIIYSLSNNIHLSENNTEKFTIYYSENFND